MNVLKTILIILGIIALVIIVLIIGGIIALIIIKPYGLDITQIPQAIQKANSDTPSSYDHPLLDEEQEKLLDSVGIDVQAIPTQITPAQEDCATEALGADRVEALKQGASPGISDYLKAKHCLE
jgi:hypothetical protein